MAEKQIQEYLFQRIKQTIPNSTSLVDVVAETLHISQDSAYRRIRGETLLVLAEAKALCEAYGISLDQLFRLTSNSVVFQNMGMNEQNGDFKTYLHGILCQMNRLNEFEQKSILYVTNDIPIFHQFCSKAVLAFRYFFWTKTIFNHTQLSKEKFSLQCLTPEIEELAKEILLLYCKIPSVEIWNTEGVNSILTQVNYYCEAGLMTREQAKEVCAGLRFSLEHVEVQAEHGRKFLPGELPQSKKDNFQLFYNRVGLGDNIILTLHDGNKTLYLNYDALNYMVTADEEFCNKVYQQTQTVLRRSTLISSASEKQRHIFFNILYSKLPGLSKEKLPS